MKNITIFNTKDKTNLIFLHKLFKALGDSTIKIFIPLFILKNTDTIELSFLYLLTYSMSTLLLMILMRKVIQKYGVICIILHAIPIILTQFILSFFTINIWIVLVCGLLAGITQTLYSIPLNLLFAFGDKSTNVAKFQVATNVGKLVFVLFSGFMISSTIENSFLYLSIIASVFYILSILPIMFGYNMLKDNYNCVSKSETLSKKSYHTFNIYHMVFSMFQSTMDNILPLYLYVNNLSFEAVSTIIALIELCKIFANYIAKYLVSKSMQLLSTTISFGLFITSAILLLIIKTPVVLYILSCIISIAFPFTFVPMFKMYCKHISQDNYIFNGMTDRDIYIFIGKFPLYSCYFIFPTLYSCFVVGILSTIIMYTCEYRLLNRKEETIIG